jgi:hypothetical protein
VAEGDLKECGNKNHYRVTAASKQASKQERFNSIPFFSLLFEDKK